jgi:ATP-dependent Clp protease protease subunit
MAKLYLNRDIIADSEKMKYWMSGDDGISFSDIQNFMAWVDPMDNRIDVEIHSCGGDCVEGYAIYDALRASGKEITCTVVGECASMATVILLAAPKENRRMYEHAKLLIHNPYYGDGISGMLTAEKLQGYANSLISERKKMLKIYTERTGQPEDVLQAQMNTDSWFESQRAIELGFVSSVVPAISAKKSDEPIINQKPKSKMAKKDEKPTLKEAFKTLASAMGFNVDPVAMEITTTTGDTLTVEREEGEIQVGDAASPDGEWVLEDGRTVIVQDGMITEIREPDTDDDTQALEDRIAELEKQVAELTANAKTDEDNAILDEVKKAGGIEALKKAAASKYVPAARRQTAGTAGRQTEEKPKSRIQQRLEEAREKAKNKYKGGK